MTFEDGLEYFLSDSYRQYCIIGIEFLKLNILQKNDLTIKTRTKYFTDDRIKRAIRDYSEI